MWKLKSLKIKNIISFKDQTYTFKNGKALLVVGKNLSDVGQKVNGAGKSAFMESISIAFTGCSVRDVKTKELINRESDSGEVELVLFNTQSDKYFKIWRKLFSNTKSALYESWLYTGDWSNDKDWLKDTTQSSRYADFNQFNAFIWQTIGITKEDFFSFFFLTGEYTPFLNANDATKKLAINRFSGADKVDVVMPVIQDDSDKINIDILKQDRLLLANTTKQELLLSQLAEAELENSEDVKNDLIEIKFKDIDLISDKIILVEDDIKEIDANITDAEFSVVRFDKFTPSVLESYQSDIVIAEANLNTFNATTDIELQPFKDEVEIAELEVDTFEFLINYDAEFNGIVANKFLLNSDINKKTLSISKVKELFAVDIKSIVDKEEALRYQVKDSEILLKELEAFESNVKKQLLDSVDCPKCGHTFHLRDISFNPAEAEAELPHIIQEIIDLKSFISITKELINTDIQKEKEDINKKISAAGDTIRKEIEVLNQDLLTLQQNESKLKQEQNKELEAKQLLVDNVKKQKRLLSSKKNELDHQSSTLSDLVKSKTRLLTQKKSDIESERSGLTNAVRRLELTLKQKQNELTAHKESMNHLEDQILKIQSQEADRSKIIKLESDIAGLDKEHIAIETELEKLRKTKESIDAWELNFKSFKSLLANKSLKTIESFTNLFLQNMESNLSIQLDGYKVLGNKEVREKITTSVLRDGFEDGGFGSFSGGERGRINLSNVIGMAELINVSSPTGGMDFLLIDECLDQIDVLGLENIILSLQPIGKTVLIISQHTEINALGEYTLTIQKENKVSTILN